MISYWGVDHGFEVSKAERPLVDRKSRMMGSAATVGVTGGITAAALGARKTGAGLALGGLGSGALGLKRVRRESRRRGLIE